jgi:hypothetical protein
VPAKSSVYAVVIEYDLVDYGSKRYQYDYTVSNNDIVDGLSKFVIDYDASEYTILLFIFLCKKPHAHSVRRDKLANDWR